MLYEAVDFKTLSDLYTNSRMVPFLTHIDGVRANLFSINPRQKMTPPSMVNQQFFFFFTVKLDATNSFPSNTTEVRPIYLHIEKLTKLPAARCEQIFILNGIGKLHFFYNIFLSIRAIIPMRAVL